MTLRPLTTSCAKDYTGHSLVQTSFTEPPNRAQIFFAKQKLDVLAHATDVHDYTRIE